MIITKEEAQKAYDDLVLFRKQNLLIKSKDNLGSIEIHHIIPISCGGLDEDSNKIALYAKEHFMAHVYLYIIHRNSEYHDQMTCALMNMHKGTLNGSRQELRDYILASEEYQLAREDFAKYCSKMFHDANLGQNNYMSGKIWICNFDLEESKTWDANLPIPAGWIKGRHSKQNFIKIKQKLQKLQEEYELNCKKLNIDNSCKDTDIRYEDLVLKNNQNKQLIKDLEKQQQMYQKQIKQQQFKYQQLDKLKLLYEMYKEFIVNEFDGVVKKFNYKHTRNNLIMSFKMHICTFQIFHVLTLSL